MIQGIVGLLILVADIWAILNVLQSETSGGGKTLWILAILSLPVIGLFFWLVAGPRRQVV